MKNIQTASVLLLGAALLLVPCSAVRAEHVFLKDGKIFEGKIAGETDAGITLIMKDNSRKIIARRDVLRMLYSDEYLTKLVIRLTNGDEFEGFIVDETRENYTIRKKLAENEEQVIPKERITYTAKKRPSELVARPTSKGIELSWAKPLGSIKKFIIYVRKKGEAYKAADDVKRNNILIKGLQEDTTYQFIVRVVDDDNYESPASNEVTVKTLKKGEATPDLSEKEKAELEKRKGRDKELSKKDTSIREDSAKMGISVRPSFILPLLDFTKTTKYGIGGIIGFDWLHVAGSGFKMGIHVGAWYMLPAGSTTKLIIAPITLRFAYEIKLASWFCLAPALDMGCSYNNLTYTYSSPLPSMMLGLPVKASASASAIKPMGLAGLQMLFLVSSRVGLGLNAQYGMIFEKSSILHLVSFSADLTFRF